MTSCNPHKTGLVGGVLLGGVHVLWAILVVLGWAQALINFSMWAHMVRMDITFGPFDMTTAIILIVVASLVGYAVGYAVGTIWNKVHG